MTKKLELWLVERSANDTMKPALVKEQAALIADVFKELKSRWIQQVQSLPEQTLDHLLAAEFRAIEYEWFGTFGT